MTHLSKHNEQICDIDEKFSVFFDRKNDSKDQLQFLIEQAKTVGTKGFTILLARQYMPDLSPLHDYLQTINIPVSGGIFPEVIYHDQYYDDGIIVIAWKSDVKVKTFEDISDSNSKLYQQASTNEEENLIDNSGCLVFVDSKTRSAENALDALYYRSENDYQYAGAGAGYFSDEQVPCIISNKGILQDAMQTIRLPLNQDNNISYGWSIVSGPHLVTSSKDNKVFTLDYLPIEDQYRKFIQNNIKEDISDATIKELIAKYPIGIHHYGEEMIIRDPYAYNDGAIDFFGDVPEFSNIFILAGKPEQLIKAVDISLKSFKQKKVKPENTLSFFFSCVGRRGYMASSSADELNVVADHLSSLNPVIGVSSFGEIATNHEGLVRFHTMSLVVSSIFE